MKTHKYNCEEIKNKSSTSRDPVIKIVERLSSKAEIMSCVENAAVMSLDLINHPENASKDAVLFKGCVVPERPGLSNYRSEQHPVESLKTLQIVDVSLLDCDFAPPKLKVIAKEVEDDMRRNGEGDGYHIIRMMWISEHTKLATLILARPFHERRIGYLRERPATTQYWVE